MNKRTKYIVVGKLRPNAGCPMPMSGTICYSKKACDYRGRYDRTMVPPKGKVCVAFYKNFKATDGGHTLEVSREEPLYIYIPLKNLRKIN